MIITAFYNFSHVKQRNTEWTLVMTDCVRAAIGVFGMLKRVGFLGPEIPMSGQWPSLLEMGV